MRCGPGFILATWRTVTVGPQAQSSAESRLCSWHLPCLTALWYAFPSPFALLKRGSSRRATSCALAFSEEP